MNELKKFLGHKNFCDLHKIKENIIYNHNYFSPTVWQILLGTIGLKPANFEKEITYNDIEYKLLFKYSFIEYLANYTLRLDSSTNEAINDHLIIVDKVERNKLIDLYSNFSGSYESLNSPNIQNIELIIDDKIIKKLQEDIILLLNETIVMNRFKLTYHHPIRINDKILHQIHIDIKRLNQGSRNVNGTDVSYMYYNILVLVSHRRPTLGYIQGMADILVLFIVEFSKENLSTAESSAYFCYLKLLDRIQRYLSGLQSDLIFLLNLHLEKIDPDVFSFLKNTKLEIHMFAFRWFNCLYIREFPYDLYLRIFITMLSYDKIDEFLVYFGVSLILKFKQQLLENGFSENIILLQTINEYEWTDNLVIELLKNTSIYHKTMGNFFS